jgi:eukaryotic-like serine/threonine-protein kinase
MVDNIRAADFQTRHLLRALGAGEPYRVARALATEACFSSSAGLSASARSAQLCAGAREAAARSGHPHALGMATFAQGFVATLEGRYREARALCHEAVRQFRDHCTSVTWEVTVMQQLELACMHYGGDLPALTTEVPALRREAVARGDLFAAANLGTWIASSAWLVEDDVAGALRAIAEANASWGRGTFLLQDYWHFYAEVQVDLYAGDAAAAWRRIEERWPELRRSLLLRIEGIRVEAHWVRARAALRLYEEQGDPALLRAAERDADVIARAAFTWGAPAADLVRAAVARARGELTTAGSLAARGAAGLDTVGVSLYAASARKDVEWMKARGVRDPAALMRLYAPGL